MQACLDSAGPIREVRLVGLRGAKHKGFAYVEMGTVAAAHAALLLDRTTIDGRPVYISVYRDKGANRPAAMRFPTNEEEHKLFVRNIDVGVTQDELQASATIRLIIISDLSLGGILAASRLCFVPFGFIQDWRLEGNRLC